MKTILYPMAIALVIGISAFTVISSVNYKIADGYSIKFTSKDPTGVFTSLKGDISFDEANPAASKFKVTVDVNSINTGNAMQNSQAKTAKWFDAATYPTITFVSTKVAKEGDKYQTTGNLTMHGVTKEITFPFTFTKSASGGVGGVFAGSFSVKRTDFKIGPEDTGHVPEALRVDLSVPVTL